MWRKFLGILLKVELVIGGIASVAGAIGGFIAGNIVSGLVTLLLGVFMTVLMGSALGLALEIADDVHTIAVKSTESAASLQAMRQNVSSIASASRGTARAARPRTEE